MSISINVEKALDKIQHSHDKSSKPEIGGKLIPINKENI